MIRHQIHGGVAAITLDSPESGNALTTELLTRLVAALREIQGDGSCRVITLAGEGRSFCSGLNLAWAFADGGTLDPGALHVYVECLRLLSGARQPVVAVVTGDVTAGGLGLVAACDIVMAAEHARFSLSEVIVGMIPALVTPFLLRRLTVARVRYLALGTRGVSAREAQVFGLVDEVVETPMAAALDRQLQRLFRSSPEALGVTKRYLAQLDVQDLERELGLARGTLLSWLEQPDVAGAIRDFADGLTPPWFQRYRSVSS